LQGGRVIGRGGGRSLPLPSGYEGFCREVGLLDAGAAGAFPFHLDARDFFAEGVSG